MKDAPFLLVMSKDEKRNLELAAQRERRTLTNFLLNAAHTYVGSMPLSRRTVPAKRGRR